MRKMGKKENVTENIKVDNSTEILKKHFPNCFDKNGNFNLEKFKEEIKINEINLSKESYSLEWLGKSYARVLTFEPARTLLKADEEWNNKPENKNSGNILIQGDNLEVLKHLVNAYYEKIKMIYIDPPYNTGNDSFVYQDNRKFREEELAELAGIDEERAKRILDFVNSKNNSHSAWLTFMYPRLYIARRLLREDGVIFVSIDDNEVAQLRILMDEIFGEENFVEIFSWKKTETPSNLGYKTKKAVEYILCYEKCRNERKFKGLKKRSDSDNPLIKPNNSEKTLKFKKDWLKTKLPYGFYKKGIYGTSTNKVELLTDFEVKDGEIDRDIELKANFIWTQENLEKEIKKGTEIRIKTKSLIVSYEKKNYEPERPWNFIDSTFGVDTNEDASKELDRYFVPNFSNKFYPKPTTLIKYLINMVCEDDDIILDFFAGSGTTGDAVMQLNAEDGGNRKFILVQLDEPIDPKKNKTAYDFVKNELGENNPTIFHICKERLVRAAKKIKEEIINKKIEEKEKEIKELESQLDVNGDNKEKIEKLKKEIEALKNQDLGFKIFETMPIWEDYLIDEKELTKQTTLFDVSKLTDEDLKALLITWKTYDGLPLTEECEEVKLNDYTAYYCGGNLYLLHTNWKTDNIKALLEKIDGEKDFVVDKVIVFGYNFTSKHMREIEENIRNYSNKKQIEIETILRF